MEVNKISDVCVCAWVCVCVRACVHVCVCMRPSNYLNEVHYLESGSSEVLVVLM